ncbi:hypothetical protein SteCoe_26479 [Stentor coeruleus]|uniref:Uncharacterized protein n=1 Tax=Stentor coeruleus TaxID=5963 RepID=A0A1R2BD03_9CILI|nr:hypothetical protein SteCoe_26479 [Stentor coeruleus]
MESNSNASPSLKRKSKPIDEGMIDSVRIKQPSDDEEFFTASEGLTDNENYNTDCTIKDSSNPSQKSIKNSFPIEIPLITSEVLTKTSSPKKSKDSETRTEKISEDQESLVNPSFFHSSSYLKFENLKSSKKNSEYETIKTDVLSQTLENELTVKPQDQNLKTEELKDEIKVETKTEAKIETKTEAKIETKTEAKIETKTEAKIETENPTLEVLKDNTEKSTIEEPKTNNKQENELNQVINPNSQAN